MSYVLTLRLDDASFGRLDALRRAHFPPERNFLRAHLTLFHQLPEEAEADAPAVIAAAAAATESLALQFGSLRSLGRGVAVDVSGPELVRLRRRLADAFEPWLTRQDAQGFTPHVTVQNKVTADAARALLAALGADWAPWSGRGEGLQLWRYAGGPWDTVAEFPFRSPVVADVEP
jgi:2'-5' RNA ligase